MGERLQRELAIEILEAIGIPKESNVTTATLTLSFASFPAITVNYTYLPDPFTPDGEGGIVSVLKKCKLVPIEEGSD